MLNLGAITSLSGFMMSDVLWLRSLSVVGSCCGITYNLTRVPRQLNAVAWGIVFASVNVIQIIRLLYERREVKFSIEEGQLYYRQFAEFGVEPRLFSDLMKTAKWRSYREGETIVPNGKPLHSVIIIFRGTAAATDPTTGRQLYTYSGSENGCIIGATTLVDPSILGRNYPNQIVAKEPVRLVEFNVKKLHAFLKSKAGGSAEAAMLHMAYVDLIGALRRHRRGKVKGKGPEHERSQEELGDALDELKSMLVTACAQGVVPPKSRKSIREFMEKHNLTQSQLVAFLPAVGWTEMEWLDGARHSQLVLKEKDKDKDVS